jgi:hypothetical protein
LLGATSAAIRIAALVFDDYSKAVLLAFFFRRVKRKSMSTMLLSAPASKGG